MGNPKNIRRCFRKQKLSKCNFLAPFYGYGGGHYRLTAVREIRVTEDFMGLDLKTINCQQEATIHDCQQAKYLAGLTKKCQCLPYNLGNYSSTYQKVH